MFINLHSSTFGVNFAINTAQIVFIEQTEGGCYVYTSRDHAHYLVVKETFEQILSLIPEGA